MRVLDRKLLRDQRRIWAQALAIALVLACGAMMQVGMQATRLTLEGSRAANYDRHRFAEVFATLTRVSALGIEEQRVRLRMDLLTPPEGRPGLGEGFRVHMRLIL